MSRDGHRERRAQPAKTAMRLVLREIERIGHPHAREREPFLLFEIGDFLGRAEAQAMRAAREKPRLEEPGYVLGSYRPVRDRDPGA